MKPPVCTGLGTVGTIGFLVGSGVRAGLACQDTQYSKSSAKNVMLTFMGLFSLDCEDGAMMVPGFSRLPWELLWLDFEEGAMMVPGFSRFPWELRWLDCEEGANMVPGFSRFP